MRQRVVVVCPGRGSYTERELGSLVRGSVPRASQQQLDAALDRVDESRIANENLTVRAMDGAERFSARFLRGENAAALIAACTARDFMRIDPDKAEVVAVLGNSMGWYTSLMCAEALSLDDGFDLVATMGEGQRDGAVGGQLIYPVVGADNWQVDGDAEDAVEAALAAARDAGHAVGHSIRLGGFAVLWGDAEGLPHLLENLGAINYGGRDYPFQLHGHAAFHSSLMGAASERGRALLSALGWGAPTVPLIDGRGKQWRPHHADPAELLRYTLENQVLDTYDFSSSVRVALREYAPDRVVLLGPGDNLGGAIAHVLIRERWQGLGDKASFQQRQSQDPFLVSLARPAQAALVAFD